MYMKAFNVTTDWSSIWISIRSLSEQNGFKLTTNDYIKVGRRQFRVKQMSVDPHASEPFDIADKKSHQEVSSSFICSPSASRSQAASCRICLSDETSAEDPLICPCKCAGTMKYIHLLCLRQWLKSSMKTRQTGSSVSYFWKTLKCELCKEKLPSSVNVKDRYIELICIPLPETSFILLEEVSGDSKGLHMISMLPGAEVRLVRTRQGRGHECDVRIDDISVSRSHAVIRMKNSCFSIEDCSSKFGTLVLAKRPLSLSKVSNIAVQINRTLMTLSVRKPSRGFKKFISSLCCTRGTSKVIDAASIFQEDDSDDLPEALNEDASSMEEGTLDAQAIAQAIIQDPSAQSYSNDRPHHSNRHMPQVQGVSVQNSLISMEADRRSEGSHRERHQQVNSSDIDDLQDPPSEQSRIPQGVHAYWPEVQSSGSVDLGEMFMQQSQRVYEPSPSNVPQGDNELQEINL
jgi:hypothetical protein